MRIATKEVATAASSSRLLLRLTPLLPPLPLWWRRRIVAKSNTNSTGVRCVAISRRHLPTQRSCPIGAKCASLPFPGRCSCSCCIFAPPADFCLLSFLCAHFSTEYPFSSICVQGTRSSQARNGHTMAGSEGFLCSAAFSALWGTVAG